MPTAPFVARLALPLLGVQTRSACLPPGVTNGLLPFLSSTGSPCDTHCIQDIVHLSRFSSTLQGQQTQVQIKHNGFRVCMETLSECARQAGCPKILRYFFLPYTSPKSSFDPLRAVSGPSFSEKALAATAAIASSSLVVSQLL